jgi:hypothetical protein
MSSASGMVLLLVFAAIAALFYFVPSFVAATRSHHNTTAIVILNIYLGWSFIGWVIALVWAFTTVTPRDPSSAPAGLSDPRMGVWIVLAIAGAFAFLVLGTLVLLCDTTASPFIYDLF